ncbi:hypothetical protein ACQUWM_12255 [Marinobacter sp. DUT-3]|uniref:hypothetical protein n=1 Tax=Marinobacter sp. DUT-3 TaxID=3412036 RepID=UPI003D162CE1
MDYAQILHHLINTLWYLISLALLAAVIKSACSKEKAGGTLDNLAAGLFFGKTRCYLNSGLILKMEGGISLTECSSANEYLAQTSRMAKDQRDSFKRCEKVLSIAFRYWC